MLQNMYQCLIHIFVTNIPQQVEDRRTEKETCKSWLTKNMHMYNDMVYYITSFIIFEDQDNAMVAGYVSYFT